MTGELTERWIAPRLFAIRHSLFAWRASAERNGEAAQPSSSASCHSLSLIRGDAEPIRNQAADPAAAAPPSAAMICMIQDALPTEFFGGATSAFAEFISAASAAVAAGGTRPAGAALPAGAASLAAARFGPAKSYKDALSEGAAGLSLAGAGEGALGALAARSTSLASSGERTCTA